MSSGRSPKKQSKIERRLEADLKARKHWMAEVLDGEGEPILAVGELTPQERRLAEQSADWIQQTMAKTVHRGMREIGAYLFERYFDSDPHRVLSRRPTRPASFAFVAELCQQASIPISKTVLRNAVAIAAMGRALAQQDHPFHGLSPSHQIELLPLRNREALTRLADQTTNHCLSVRALRELVAAEKEKQGKDPRGRKKQPDVIKKLRAITRQLAPGAVKGALFTPSALERLSEAQRQEARELLRQLHVSTRELAKLLRQ